MGSRVWYHADAACGIPGCPIVIKIDGSDECELMERLSLALREHQKSAHIDGSPS